MRGTIEAAEVNSLKERQTRGDLIESSKIIHNYYTCDLLIHFNQIANFVGILINLSEEWLQKLQRKHFITNQETISWKNLATCFGSYIITVNCCLQLEKIWNWKLIIFLYVNCPLRCEKYNSDFNFVKIWIGRNHISTTIHVKGVTLRSHQFSCKSVEKNLSKNHLQTSIKGEKTLLFKYNILIFLFFKSTAQDSSIPAVIYRRNNFR